MTYNPVLHHRRSIRLRGYDYSTAGMYFVTICVKDREHSLGDIVNGEMRLSRIGDIAEECWEQIPEHFPNAMIDEFVIMPDHMHGILLLRERNLVRARSPVEAQTLVGAQYIEPPQNTEPRRVNVNKFQKLVPGSISSIIRSYKAAVTRTCHQRGLGLFKWQSNYYDHIIRDGADLDRVRKYIQQNTSAWMEDRENPGVDSLGA